MSFMSLKPYFGKDVFREHRQQQSEANLLKQIMTQRRAFTRVRKCINQN